MFSVALGIADHIRGLEFSADTSEMAYGTELCIMLIWGQCSDTLVAKELAQ